MSYRVLIFIAVALVASDAYFFVNRKRLGTYTDFATYDKLYTNCGQRSACIADWTRNTLDLSKEEWSEGMRISTEEMGITKQQPVMEKVTRIMKWISRYLGHGTIGQPSAAFEQMGLPAQMKEARYRHTPIWCGNFAQYFSFFCTINGITFRAVQSNRANDSHSLNECFIAEWNKWILVDPMHGNAGFRDTGGRYLSMLDVRELADRPGSKISFCQVEDTVAASRFIDYRDTYMAKFVGQGSVIYFYKSVNLEKVYSPAQKFKRYFLPVSWHLVYEQPKKSNFSFYLKDALALLTVLFLGWIAWYKLKRKS